jgi:hypothetical protein
MNEQGKSRANQPGVLVFGAVQASGFGRQASGRATREAEFYDLIRQSVPEA